LLQIIQNIFLVAQKLILFQVFLREKVSNGKLISFG
jgi:hypothetical protein